ncbi:MAG: type II toxin-antitoxin system prevent-host-death family antitoxin [Synechococcaceae cyanobacterium]|nr:type II toxin-antitoxin system prevent-host-death family antitoxin [Synechococcaceae cyanobacterium]
MDQRRGGSGAGLRGLRPEAGAKRAANQGPVFITDRGRPAHVLLSIEEYRRLLGDRGRIAELLAFPGAEDVELPLLHPDEPARAADLS